MSIYIKKWAVPIAGILFVLLLSSCSGKSGSDGSSATGESIYDAGAAVDAVPFADSKGIELYLLDSNGESVRVHDGDYLSTGTKTFAVNVSGDLSDVDKVFISDGGAFQVEAILKDGRYVCEFPVSSDNLYQIMLVQVLHANGKASKEKIVLRSSRSYHDTGYIKNGVGILISQEILDDQKEDLAELLGKKIDLLFSTVVSQNPTVITHLSYGDGNTTTTDVVINSLEAVKSDSYPTAAVHLNFTIRNVYFSGLPLFGQDFVTTQQNDLTIDTYMGIKDVNGKGQIRLVLDPQGTARVQFARAFFFRGVIQDKIASGVSVIDLPPIALSLKEKSDDLRALLPTRFLINDSEVDVNTLLDGLSSNLERYLFVDAYRSSDDALPGVLALGLGLCVEDKDNIVWSAPSAGEAPEALDMEKIFTDILQSSTNSMFNVSKQKYKGLITKLAFGDGNPSTADVVVNSLVLGNTGTVNVKTAQIDFTVKRVDLEAISLFGFPFISTSDNDLTIKGVFNVEYRETSSGKKIVVTPQSVSSVVFDNWFLGKLAIEAMIMEDLLGMSEQVTDLNSVLSGFELSIDMAQAISPQAQYPVFPDLAGYDQVPGWELQALSPYNIQVAMSQNCINWLLEDVLSNVSEWDVKQILIPILGESFSGFGTVRPQGEATVLSLSVPPALDLRYNKIRVVVPDAIVQYRLSGVPQWEASIDLDLIITPKFEDGKLNFYVSATEGQNHFHIMKDNRGNLGLFDHSPLVQNTVRNLPRMLGNAAGGPVVSFDPASIGANITYKNVSSPLQVTTSGGYLYLDIAALSLDLMKFVDLFSE